MGGLSAGALTKHVIFHKLNASYRFHYHSFKIAGILRENLQKRKMFCVFNGMDFIAVLIRSFLIARLVIRGYALHCNAIILNAVSFLEYYGEFFPQTFSRSYFN